MSRSSAFMVGIGIGLVLVIFLIAIFNLTPTQLFNVKPEPTVTDKPTATQEHKPTSINASPGVSKTPLPERPTPTPVLSTNTAVPPTFTFTPTSTPTLQIGCQRPPDDYERVQVNGETLNARTLWMLQQAAVLYEGPADLLHVTQGSYRTDIAVSFGTHAGGGAVDISIRNPANRSEILWNETDAMLLALRRAGFAAWYRAPGDLGADSAAHIHAIAIGDRELSPAAIEQLTGPGGYFRGLDGLPPEYGGPHPDRHGGPIICSWMIEIGYQDMRQ